ncbi:MAG: oxygen-independent coproporphyrinogen III oxidase [Crocinitomicaceae bacterium]|nr:oxygen-independent coproporphyrinogen III oxidase [Flavobacteriales bacterium]NQZ35344.1 oxygen-independent coproporphyrinogen III oxidase [Crocinitomicaceae bacterium]
MNSDQRAQLIRKYDVPGPRYTSYPTVPYWKNEPLSNHDWLTTIRRNQQHFAKSEVSLYVHLPYCESLCTFCGCHKRITKNHSVEQPYIDAVIKEWKRYKTVGLQDSQIRELHFGGGTPTFFAADELVRLVNALLEDQKIDPSKVEMGFEAHPNNTSEEHLEKLFVLGFRRLSLGVQDYNPIVQKAIHRIQPFSQVKKVHDLARKIGYNSISHDLVFGLPKQRLKDILFTVEKTLELRPDRISLYSYAHVPWVKGTGQRGFDDDDLPTGEVKRELYEQSKLRLLEAGYLEIGMDHFALKEDSLAQAFQSKNLHRNFMGYTTQNTPMLIGLGMSAISDSWFGFAQNKKSVEAYLDSVNKDELPIFRGHLLSEEDLIIRQHILDLMCHFETKFGAHDSFDFNMNVLLKLKEMVEDELVEVEGDMIRITEKGIPFVRNVCMIFDRSLQSTSKREGVFSRTI